MNTLETAVLVVTLAAQYFAIRRFNRQLVQQVEDAANRQPTVRVMPPSTSNSVGSYMPLHQAAKMLSENRAQLQRFEEFQAKLVAHYAEKGPSYFMDDLDEMRRLGEARDVRELLLAKRKAVARAEELYDQAVALELQQRRNY